MLNDSEDKQSNIMFSLIFHLFHSVSAHDCDSQWFSDRLPRLITLMHLLALANYMYCTYNQHQPHGISCPIFSRNIRCLRTCSIWMYARRVEMYNVIYCWSPSVLSLLIPKKWNNRLFVAPPKIRDWHAAYDVHNTFVQNIQLSSFLSRLNFAFRDWIHLQMVWSGWRFPSPKCPANILLQHENLIRKKKTKKLVSFGCM